MKRRSRASRRTGGGDRDHAAGPTPLPAPLRQRAETRLGVSLSALRLHLDSDEPGRRGGRALSTGDSIHLGPGSGLDTLGHELIHVAQGRRHGEAKGATALDAGRGSPAEGEAAALGGKLFAPEQGLLPVRRPRDAYVHRQPASDADGVCSAPGGQDNALARGLFPNLSASFSPAWAASLSDEELRRNTEALTSQMALLAKDSAEHDAAAANAGVIEAERVRRNLIIWQRDDDAEAMARRPGGPPCVFAVDDATGHVYVSVTPPGATLRDIATYVYGDASLAGELAAINGLLSIAYLPAGSAVRLIEGRQSAVATAAIAASRKTGTMLHTKGVQDTMAKDDLVYQFPGGAGMVQVNSAQFQAMLQALRKRTRVLTEIHLDSIRFLHGLWTDHSRENSFVRGISDWSGDATMPSETVYETAEANGASVLAMLDGLEFQEDPRMTAAQLGELQQAALDVMQDDANLEAGWTYYISGTISGAEKSVHRLEFVRNTSFAMVAGMAGAVAAPAAFAAMGGATLTGGAAFGATVTSLGVAGTTGGLIRGGLEVALPGAQADVPAAERFGRGYWSGYIGGVTGGVGSFAAPVVSSAVSGQLATAFGRQFVQSGVGQVAVNSATGAIIGAPSGAAASSVENLPAYLRGDITGEQYSSGITGGAKWGGILGAASPIVPVKGFTRANDIPFSTGSAPVVPEWTMAGPFSPLARITGATAGFNSLAQSELPAFADDPGVAGYAWTRVRSGGVDTWAPMRTYGPKQDFDVAWYADPANPSSAANFNLMYGPQGGVAPPRLVGSRSLQRPAGAANGYGGMQADDPFPGAPRSTREDFPMTTDDFEVTMPDGTARRMTRGHQIDFRDTTNRTAAIPDSNLDPRNFTPEPGAWGGLSGRNRLTVRMRNSATGGGTQYRQINIYGDRPGVTSNGTPVPDSVYLVEMGPNGAPARAWHVPFDNPAAFQGINMHSPAAIDTAFGVPDLSTLPTPIAIDPSALPPAVLAAATAGLKEDQP